MSTAHYSVPEQAASRNHPILVVLFWLYVSIPLAWGVFSTMQKAMALLH